MNLLIEDLKRDEGLELRPYLDTVNKWTIGYGWNLDAHPPSSIDLLRFFRDGITKEEAEKRLIRDILEADQEAKKMWPWINFMGSARKDAVTNMLFNLGATKLRKFAKMLAALESGDFDQAANEAMDSKWADQVGDRAKRIEHMIRRNERASEIPT